MITFRYLLVLLFIILSSSYGVAQNKHALLVGISNYHALDKDTGWNDLNGVNDINLLSPVLKSQGFTVTSLLDLEANYNNIVECLNELARKCHAGDIVYIHFSMHGQPFDDKLSSKRGDEDWDESLVPIDAPLEYDSKSYRGQNHLVDDDLNKYTNLIRNRLGALGILYVTIDACHAGGASKDADFEISRGSKIGFSAKRQYIVKSKRPQYYNISTSKGQSPVVYLEACQGNEVNREIWDSATKKYYGPLSYHIYQVLKKHRIGMSISWTNIVRKQMNEDSRIRKQHMVIESSVKQ